MKEVYLDHAATTYLDPRVKEAMAPYWDDVYGNPSSLYRQGRLAKDAVERARETVARILNARSDEIIFTAGSTEADNIAILGVTQMFRGSARLTTSGSARPTTSGSEHSPQTVRHGSPQAARHLITSAIEHHASLRAFEALAREGWEVSYIPVEEDGIVDPADIEKAIRPDTLFVSLMYANNEIGTIQPIAEVGKLIASTRKERQESGNQLPIYFHSDASQAAGFLELDVKNLGVDLMSMSGGKIYGPKGSGALYVRAGTRLKPISFGGGQEKGLRSGTENVPGIVGFSKALEIAEKDREPESARLCELRDYMIHRLTSEIPKTVLNGHRAKRLPNNVNVSVLDIEGEAVILYLDAKGISISTGSACTSTTLDPSHVILALGKPYEYAHSSLRFTLGRSTTREDLDYVMEVFPAVVERLRSISPVRMEVGQKTVSHPEAFAGQGSKIKVGGRTYK